MSYRLKLRHLLMGLGIGMVLSFQNCSTPLGESGGDFASYRFDLPFAYKASVDTIAYMSCSRMSGNPNPRAYFSFRAGAYTASSGLSVNQEFLDAIKYFSDANKRTAFAESEANADARLQLAIRKANNLQSHLYNGSYNPGDGSALGGFLDVALDHTQIADTLVNTPSTQWRQYFPGTFSNRRVEATLSFKESENVMNAIRESMNRNESMLAMTYTATDDADDPAARGPEGRTAAGIYGKGFAESFRYPTGWASALQRTLASVREVDLQTGLTYGNGIRSWSCPIEYQFVIVRPQDLNTHACATTADSYTAAQAPAYNALRRVLAVEDWWVDMARRCIVPKPSIQANLCYGDGSNSATVDYTSGACNAGTCPHYVSICVAN